MKKSISIITSTLLVLVIVLAIALVGVRMIGIAPYTVLSGSMEPTYPVGSIIYVKQVDDVTSLRVGDPLTYVIEGGTVVTHRIIEIIPNYGEDGSPGFKTKGDNNQVEDGTPVHGRNVLGKPIFHIPVLGYLAYFVQNPPGSFIAIGFCAVIVLLTFVPDAVDKMAEAPPTESKPTEGEATPSPQIAAELEELKRMLAARGVQWDERTDHPPDAHPPDAHPPDGHPPDKNEHPPNRADDNDKGAF